MKKFHFLLALAALMLAFSACKKNNGNEPEAPRDPVCDYIDLVDEMAVVGYPESVAALMEQKGYVYSAKCKLWVQSALALSIVESELETITEEEIEALGCLFYMDSQLKGKDTTYNYVAQKLYPSMSIMLSQTRAAMEYLVKKQPNQYGEKPYCLLDLSDGSFLMSFSTIDELFAAYGEHSAGTVPGLFSKDNTVVLYGAGMSDEIILVYLVQKSHPFVEPTGQPNNVICYTAANKLPEIEDEFYGAPARRAPQDSYEPGLYIKQFNAKVVSHTFADGKGTITFDGDVTFVNEMAFCELEELTSLSLPNSVTYMAPYAIWRCGLTGFHIPVGIKYMAPEAINECEALAAYTIDPANKYYNVVDDAVYSYNMDTLCFYPIGKEATSYVVPGGVKYIYDFAANCHHLTSLDLPASLETIGVNAFYNYPLESLTQVTCHATTPPSMEKYTFSSYISTETTLYVPEESLDAYKAHSYWGYFAQIKAIHVEKYGVYVKDEQVTSDNCNDILGDGTLRYDDATKTLTLNNAKILYAGGVIRLFDDIQIECIGENRIEATDNSVSALTSDAGSTTILGTGSVTFKAQYSAIDVQNDLIIKGGCSVTAQSAGDVAIGIAGETLTIDGANLTAKGNGIEATISGCYELVMKNGVQIDSNHTYDATTHHFISSATGIEATDDIIFTKQ